MDLPGVVLHYDMLGYGDSRQFDHHASLAGVEDALRLQSLFGFQTWDSLCALDALCALPDVDPARIAVVAACVAGGYALVGAVLTQFLPEPKADRLRRIFRRR